MRKKTPPRTTSERIDPDLPKDEGPLLSAIESILSQVSKDADKSNTFAVIVGQGKLLYFRRPENAEELDIFQQAGIAFVLLMKDKENRSKLPPHIQEALEFAGKAQDADLINAFTIHFWSVEPEMITQAQAIKFTRNPVVLQSIISEINREHAHGMRVMNLGGVTIAKKD